MFEKIINKFNKDVDEALAFLDEKEFSPDYPHIETEVRNVATVAEKNCLVRFIPLWLKLTAMMF